MYKKYIHNQDDYIIRYNYEINKQYLNNIFSNKINQEIFERNKKILNINYVNLIIIAIIELLLAVLIPFYFGFWGSFAMLLITLLYAFSFAPASFILVCNMKFIPPFYSMLTLLFNTYTLCFNLGWYYLYYINLIYQLYEKNEADIILKKVFNIEKYVNGSFFQKIQEKNTELIPIEPLPFFLSWTKHSLKKKEGIVKEEFNIDKSKYTKYKIEKEMKQPFIFLHVYNIVLILIAVYSIISLIFINKGTI